MEKLIEDIKTKIFQIENQFAKCSELDLKYKSNVAAWSKKEILGHLIDSAQNNIRRIVVGQYIENENIIYEQNIWVKAANYQAYNSVDLVDLFVLLNKHFCILLQNLPKENYTTHTNWGKETPELVSLEYMANDYLRHMQHHYNQMFKDTYKETFDKAK
jgi:hypothetical protein